MGQILSILGWPLFGTPHPSPHDEATEEEEWSSEEETSSEEEEGEEDEESQEEGWDEAPESLETRLQQAQLLHEIIHQIVEGPWAGKLRDAAGIKSRLSVAWQKEENFLRRMEEGCLEMNASRLASSNFPHLYALLCLLRSGFVGDVCDVLAPLDSVRHPPPHGSAARPHKAHKMNVDLIAASGRLWVSIMARKGQHVTWRRESAECKNGLKDKVRSLLEASAAEPFPPLLLLVISQDVPVEVTDRLQDKWNVVQVPTELVTWPRDVRVEAEDSEFGSLLREEEILAPYPASFWLIVPPHYPLPASLVLQEYRHLLASEHTYLNLDTSTLMALTSDMTNGKAPALLQYLEENEPPRRQRVSEFMEAQVREEVESPLAPFLQGLLQDQHLIVTQQAHDHFLHILMKIGSPSEKERGQALLNRTRIFEQVDWAEELHCPLFRSEYLQQNRVDVLPPSKTLKELPRNVFGRGDSIPTMVTATSNHSVVRAAREQGVFLRVVLHPPRSLMTNRLQFL